VGFKGGDVRESRPTPLPFGSRASQWQAAAKQEFRRRLGNTAEGEALREAVVRCSAEGESAVQRFCRELRAKGELVLCEFEAAKAKAEPRAPADGGLTTAL